MSFAVAISLPVAVPVLEQAFAALQVEFVAAGKIQIFDKLKLFLGAEAAPGDYAALAGELG